MATALIAGPCISEFGWELMEWQGHVRALALKHDHVVVCSTATLQPLYADYNPIFVGHNIRGVRDCHTMRKIDNQGEWDRVYRILLNHKRSFEESGYTVRWEQSRPQRGAAVGTRRPIENQAFVQFGTPSNDGFDLVIHARNRPFKYAFEGHNYPLDKWNELIVMLKEHGYEHIAAIGTTDQALLPEGVVDRRGAPLDEVMNMMSSARLMLGPSSGPMHLASLCGTPHVVWARDRQQSAINKRNKERYESYWNPLETPTRVILHGDKEVIDPGRIVVAALELDTHYVEDGEDAEDEQRDEPIVVTSKRDQMSGVVYVAVGRDYIDSAAISIDTLRRVFSGPVMVITDKPDNKLESLKTKYGIDVLVHPTNTNDNHRSSRVLKTQVMKLCPYDYGMFIDADTLVLNRIHQVWGVLGARNIAMARSQHYPRVGDAGRAKEHMKYDIYSDDFKLACEVAGKRFPHYHSSTIVWRRSEEIIKLAEMWYEEWQHFKGCDMFPLARALFRSNVRISKLPRKYNLRFHMSGDTVVYSARLDDIRKVYKRLFPVPNITRVRERAMEDVRPAMTPVAPQRIVRSPTRPPSVKSTPKKPKGKSLRQLLAERKNRVRPAP